MSRFVIAVIAVISVLSLSACADDWIGKGKGKAPPPDRSLSQPPFTNRHSTSCQDGELP